MESVTLAEAEADLDGLIERAVDQKRAIRIVQERGGNAVLIPSSEWERVSRALKLSSR